MGYYVDFKFNLSKFDDSDAIVEIIEAIEDEIGTLYPSDEEDDVWIKNDKWMNWKEDIKEIISNYPDQLLIVDGHDGNARSLWRAYFQNGKCQIEYADILYPEFDEKKLK